MKWSCKTWTWMVVKSLFFHRTGARRGAKLCVLTTLHWSSSTFHSIDIQRHCFLYICSKHITRVLSSILSWGYSTLTWVERERERLRVGYWIRVEFTRLHSCSPINKSLELKIAHWQSQRHLSTAKRHPTQIFIFFSSRNWPNTKQYFFLFSTCVL